jgi:L-methionine (R)-S-oxide reductase
MTLPARQVIPTLLQVDAILGRLAGNEALTEVCRFLRSELVHFRWVGVYRLDGPLLRLVAWSGEQPTEHTTIPVGQGICGRAARENATIVVNDVRAAPDYLACFLETRSELVAPIRAGGAVIGELDVDGNEVGAFDATDARFAEQLSAKLAAATQAASPLLGE